MDILNRTEKSGIGESRKDWGKAAIVHERLNVLAGSEKVMFMLSDIFPNAPIFTSIADKALVASKLPYTDVHTSFLQKIPFAAKHHQKLLPLYMLAFEQFDLSPFDLVISSSHCASKSVITRPDACHICYCHSPMRYAWDMQHDYARYQPRLMRGIWSLVSNYVRLWDFATAARVDYFVANSRHVARRICKYYGRKAAVIHPPVDIERFYVSPSVGDYHLVVSRFAPYKRVDLIVQAFNQLGWHLVIVGNGEQEAYLKKIAGPNIEFTGYVTDSEVADYYAHCKASIHAAEEDFGINMVESLASGRPVVAYGVGGAQDIIKPGVNGVLFRDASVGSLIAALKDCDARHWDAQVIKESSEEFSCEHFKRNFAAFTEWAQGDFDQRMRSL